MKVSLVIEIEGGEGRVGDSNRPMHWHTSVPILPLSSLEWSLEITGVGRA